MINPVHPVRPMEGIMYPEHLAPGVPLDSRFSTGMLQVKPLPSLVHKILLVARPQVEIKTSHWKPVINPVMDINTDDLHVKKFPYPAPLEQSVLGVLPEIRMDETDGLKCPSRTTQLYCEQPDLQSSARTMSETEIVDQTDVNDDMNTDLPESSAPMLKSPTIFERPYVKSSALATLNQGIVNQTDVTLDMDTDPPESSALMINSDLMIVDWEDIFCGRPRYGGQDWHDMIDTDNSEPEVRKRMDTADLVYMCRTVAQDHRWSNTDDNSDTDSVAELEYSAWDDACAG